MVPKPIWERAISWCEGNWIYLGKTLDFRWDNYWFVHLQFKRRSFWGAKRWVRQGKEKIKVSYCVSLIRHIVGFPHIGDIVSVTKKNTKFLVNKVSQIEIWSFNENTMNFSFDIAISSIEPIVSSQISLNGKYFCYST